MMRKFHGVALMFGLLLCFVGGASAQTLTIDIVPASQDVVVGDTVEVDLVISGLGDGLAPSIGTFDLDVTFDPDILSFQSATFGNQLDVLGLGSITQDVPGVMHVNIFELSLDTPGDLDALQLGGFTLATLSFDTLAAGTSSLDLSINALGDALGDPLNANIGNGTVTVGPEPTADLGITKSDAADPVTVGDNVSYTVVVSNGGPAEAENVVMTDTLPSGVTFVSATPDQGSCSESGGVVTCNLGTMANGSSLSIVIMVMTTTAGTLMNAASVVSDTADPNPGNNTASQDTIVKPVEADLSISKSDDVDPIVAGNTLTYTLIVNNVGPGTAQNVVVTDTLPPGVTFVSSSGCTNDPTGVPTCSLGTIAASGSAQYTIVVTVDAGTTGSITNMASVTSETADPNPSNNNTTEATLVNAPVADLSISKSDDVDPIVAGNTLTYTLIVNNVGPGTAQNVVVTDTLPPGVTFVSSSGCTNDPTGVPTCSLGTIAASGSAQYTIVVTVDAGTTGSITNMASVTSETADPNPGNNSDTEPTTVEEPPPLRADLRVSKSDAVDPVTAGDDVTYTVEVSNSGPDAAQNIVLTDMLPAGVIFVSATPDQGSCSESGGVVTCDLDTVANGSSVSIVIVVTTTVEDTLTNTASVTSETTDPDPGNNSATEQTTVEPPPLRADLGVSKSDAVDPVTAGDDVTYTVEVSNSGPDAAQNAVLTDTLPGGVTFDSATPDQGNCSESGGTVTCELGSMANGDSVSIVIVVTTTIEDTLTNTASVVSDTTDPDTSNNSDTEQTTVDRMIEQCPDDVLISNYQTTSPQFVEVANVGSDTIDLNGCSLVTFDAVTELSIGNATKDLSGTLEPGETQQVAISGAPTARPGGIGIFNAPALAGGTRFSADNEITGMVYLANNSVFGIAHLTVPEHNDIYDCIYGTSLPPGNFPRTPLDECFSVPQ